MRDYPQVDIQLQLLDRFIDLVDEGVGLAIRIGQLPDSDLVARRIIDHRLSFIGLCHASLSGGGGYAGVAGLSLSGDLIVCCYA
ncbi:MAG: LysR substrate-binding domain-containing protein [Pantoea sp.]|uniref:LysR substrate-binding domain-containing protein n=1 Tax=Pantoea sp. TaxID=69393 RepID=UPI0039E3E262